MAYATAVALDSKSAMIQNLVRENAITRYPDSGAFSIAAPRLLMWATSLAQTGASTRLYEVLNRIVQDAVASMARRMSIRMEIKLWGSD